MIVNILKIICWFGYGICGILLLGYLFSYLKIKKQVNEDRRENDERK